MKKELSIFLDYLKLLVRTPSVVGFEAPFMRALERELEELNIKTTRYHGLLVAEGNAPNSHYLSAHVDRHGLLCTGPKEFQYAAFIAQNRSEQTGTSTSEEMMLKIAHRFAGERVMAYDPWSGSYLGHGTIRDAFIDERIKNLFMIIEGFDHLSAGIPIAYSDRIRVQDGKISAQLDNVLSAAIILHLFANGFQGTAFFTAQEEAGRSWRYLAEWFSRKKLSTNRLIVLDTSPFNTADEAFNQDLVLRWKDASAAFDKELTQEIEQLTNKHSISTVFKDLFIDEINDQKRNNNEKELSLGRTELGRLIEATSGNVTGTTLQIPTIEYHTSNETATLRSVESALLVLKDLVQNNVSTNFIP